MSKTYTVRTLVNALNKYPPTAKVRFWVDELDDMRHDIAIRATDDGTEVHVEIEDPNWEDEEEAPRHPGYRVEVVRGGGSARDASGRFVRRRR